MNIRKKVFFFALVGYAALLTACGDQKGNTNTALQSLEPEGNTFSSRYDSLKVLEIPAKIDWKMWDRETALYRERAGPMKTASLLDNPVAKALDAENYKAIIFVSHDETGAPTLITINKNEQPIDTLFLLGDVSSNDPNWRTVEQAEINADRTIVLLDSVFHWELDDAGNRIDQTMKLTVTGQRFRVLDSGVFVEIKE